MVPGQPGSHPMLPHCAVGYVGDESAPPGPDTSSSTALAKMGNLARNTFTEPL